jgi:hypothetical protein
MQENRIEGVSPLWYNQHMKKQSFTLACKAIMAHNPNAHGIIWHYDNNYSAMVNRCVAYYVIIDNKIVGDVWYE